MVERSPAREEPADDRLGPVFAALADPTRRRILGRLRDGAATVSALADPFPMSFAAVSKHVRVLERAGLVRREVHGREHRLSLEAAPLREAAAWTLGYRDFWEPRLDALDALLRREKRREPRRPRRRRR